MLKIKLSRFGRRNQPHFRIVVNEARDKRDGSYVEMVGYYSPSQQPKTLELDIKKYDAWIAKGAQPTETVAYLYEIAKTGKGFPEKKKKASKKQLAKQLAEKEAKQKPAEGEVEEEQVKKEDEKEAEAVEKPAEKEKEVEKEAEVKEVSAKETDSNKKE